MSVSGTNQAPTTKAPESTGKQDSEDGAKSLKKRQNFAEAKSAPNQSDAIASFIMPDSMADIFGNDYKPPPPEISEQPTPKQEQEKLTEIKQVEKPIEPEAPALNETLVAKEKEIPKVSHSQEKDIKNDKNPAKREQLDQLEEKKELKE